MVRNGTVPADKKCVPCRSGTPPLGKEEIDRFLVDVPGWVLKPGQGGAAPKIERRFEFKNFAGALDFVNKLGRVAEEQDHHPDIAFGWGYAVVAFSTHAIGGLHENDFVMAARANAIV